MASRPISYLTVEGTVVVRRSGDRARTPVVLEFAGRKYALTPDQAADLQLQLAALLLRMRRAD